MARTSSPLENRERETMDPDPLLSESDPLTGVVDYRGRPVSRASSGGWNSALFIIGAEIPERCAFYGITSNLIMYVTGPLGVSTAAAAAALSTWSGVSLMLPLLGAFLADSYLGRYRTIVLVSLLYILSLSMLTLSALLPSVPSPHGGNTLDLQSFPASLRVPLFYVSLYLLGFAEGAHKLCLQALGADQFDDSDPKECILKSVFFNWWFFAMSAGLPVTVLVLSYVQDNIGWGFGFGIPCIVMLFSFSVFLLGTRTYRNSVLDEESPFVRIGKTFVALARYQEATQPRDKALMDEHGCSFSSDHVDEAKGVLRLFGIWATCLIYATAFVQQSLFTKQASTLDRRIGSSFQIPPAALQIFINVSVLAFVPIYDRILVPITRKLSKIPSGLTMLQRIGVGIAISLISMVIAALVEMKRLKTARDYGLVDQPEVAIPMSLWWMVPQYVLYGMAEVFTLVGLQEFFYDQVPDALRSIGLALYLSIFGVGSFISSILISAIDKQTRKGGDSWFSNNLNRAHLDYFYWLLAGLSAFGLLAFVYCAQAYVYKKKVDI
ncbi:protein NRT1/ PTR FAMILY 5.10-like [Typha angustifolia]|uniref:protein NRT1/ PTR FAMILY 5.10-like n=1 Tax=Typha angustifolia TaxID=59011 RepID=UPI003C2EF899